MERERERGERREAFAARLSLSRGYIGGRWPASAKRTPPAPPGARRPPKTYPEGGKLINEFGSRPQPAPTVSLADRKILIQRVYRRAMTVHSEATTDHGLPTQASATADGGRARVAGVGTSRQYSLWITKSWPRKPLFSLLSLSLFPTGQIILLNSKNL